MVYRFDNYELDTHRQELRRAGVLVKIERQAFRVLAYLVQHRHRVVTKQELAEHLWLQTFVSDEALARCLRLVRQALGDSGRAQHFIRTMYGNGYRFVAAAEEETPTTPSNNGNASAHPPLIPQYSLADHTHSVQRPLLPGHAPLFCPFGHLLSPSGTMLPSTYASHLPSPCPSCGGLGTASAQDDGMPGSAVTPAHEVGLPDRPTMAAEWKPVTALSCTVTNLATLGQCPTPEGQHSLRYEFFTLVQRQVQQYGGSMQYVTDDSFLALFGVPVPYEDHAWRALDVAMTLQHHLQTSGLVPGIHSDARVELRIGLHTGRVVGEQIGSDRRVTYIALGDTTSLAVSLQQSATPGTILLSAVTARQVQSAVRLEPLAPVVFPGEAAPTLAYQVLAARSRRAAHAGRVPCPGQTFVGRRWEMERLQMALARAMSGQGQVVSIVSEPGMGKSRLLHEFRSRLRGQPVTYLEGHCSAYDGALPYGPVCEILRQLCRLSHRDTLEVRSKKLRRMLAVLGLESDTGVQCLLHLLGMPPHSTPSVESHPEAITVQAFDLLRQLCLKGSQHQPLVLAVENLQWIDSASETLCAMLIDVLAGAPLLLLTTARLDYQPPWMAKSYTTQIVLPSLSPEESLAVVNAIDEPTPLSSRTAQEILAMANGNPFFLQELVHAARAASRHPGDPVPVPDTIQNVLMARLGRLPEAQRRLLQTAAVLGRTWPLRLLEALWDGPEALPSLLWDLQRREFLYEQTATTEPSYAFRDMLMQDVAYHSLVLARRQTLHALAASALATLYGECWEDVAERMAYHRQRL